MSALTKLIDFLGLTAQTEELVDAMDAKDADNLQAAKSYADTVAAAAGSSAAASSIPLSQKGTPGGVAELNSQGIVPSHQLPSFVDDVIEGYRLGQHFYSDAAHTTIVTDETGQSADQLSGKIYVDLGDNQTYRWAGSDYAVISESLALGTTEATAGRGDWNYTAYQHALAKGSQFASNLYKITTNAEGHVIAATPVTKQDIVDLGIPGSDTVYEDATTATHGLMSASDKAKLDGVESGAQVNPNDATTTAHGLMSAADKAKLDGIEVNANNYSLPTMSPTTKGGAKVGHGLSVEGDALNIGPLTDSGSGASVQTDGCGIFGVMGEGWAEQDTTTGKNLGGTFEDGNYQTDGSNITSTTRVRSYGFLPVTAGTVYTVSGHGESGKTLNVSMSWFSTNDGNTARVDYTNWSALPTTITAPSGALYGRLLFKYADNSAITAVKLQEVQLELGSTATSYEPYSGGKPGPNPDYPQEIKVARGRNLFDKSLVTAGYWDPSTGEAGSGGTWRKSDKIPVNPGNYWLSGYTNFSGNFIIYGADGHYIKALDSSEVIHQSGGSLITIPTGAAILAFYFGTGFTIDTAQLEQGTEATPYVPYGHIGLDITANGQTTTTPIPLPAKGFAAKLGDYADTLEVDSAGRCEWTNRTGMHVVGNDLAYSSGNASRTVFTDVVSNLPSYTSTTDTPLIMSSHFVAISQAATWVPGKISRDKNSMSNVYYIVDPSITTPSAFLTAYQNVEVLHPIAASITESSYIQLPELPAGATVSIPELEAIGVEWWVEGAEAIIEHTFNWAKRIEELEAKFASLGIEETIVNTNGNVTVTYTNGLHVGYNQETFNMYTLPSTPMGVSNEWIYNYDEHVS